MTGCSVIFRTIIKYECDNNCFQDLAIDLPLIPIVLRSPTLMIQLGSMVWREKGKLMTWG